MKAPGEPEDEKGVVHICRTPKCGGRISTEEVTHLPKCCGDTIVAKPCTKCRTLHTKNENDVYVLIVSGHNKKWTARLSIHRFFVTTIDEGGKALESHRVPLVS